jgi:hypothetical protein
MSAEKKAQCSLPQTLAVHQEFVTDESLLECRAHKGVTVARTREDGEVHVEE